tara:strand:- start:816 stop:2336 length:1521 start_codon:yes stop_codon:yes gene_type:complete
MGLLDDTTHQQYYQGNDYGNYQFTSLDDVITQFQIAYVGEDKIISKVKRSDIAFHAQRALQELSFDTFKSTKSQQIDVPASLTMKLPHDYVNYTKLSWTDSAGIKHPLYPTSATSNPFQIRQEADGTYSFPSGYELLENPDFSNPFADAWEIIAAANSLAANYSSGIEIVGEEVNFSYVSKNGFGHTGYGQVSLIWQSIDVSDLVYIDISADGVAEDITYTAASGVGTADGTAISTVRFGLSSLNPTDPSVVSNINNIIGGTVPPTQFAGTSIFDLTNGSGESSYVEWTGNESSTKTVETIDVTNIDTVYAIGLSFVIFSAPLVNGKKILGNSFDNLSVTNSLATTSLQPKIGNEKNSSTWNSYKSGTPSENQDDYQDDTYWPMDGARYGLDPQHAQANGSFYMDNILGKIHFSSNVSGKTVILDYISDSLGTDGEMQVHKFAEEAMYKWIAHAILATRANTQEYLVNRFKKERFAAVRTAKLRLSNIKLEEITQVFRGKSKQIKH